MAALTEDWFDAVRQTREAVLTKNKERLLEILDEIMGCCGYDSAEEAMHDLMTDMGHDTVPWPFSTPEPQD